MAFDPKTFGKRLNRARKDRGFTSNALAEKVFFNPVHIRHMEGGSRKPSIDGFVDICNALQVSPDELLYDQLGDYVKGMNRELADKFSRLTPSQKDVAMATIDALLAIPEKE